MGEESDGNWAMYIWEDKIAGSGAILTYGESIEPGSGHPRP
jgi:hypothetical protein